jgi:hypothetical protein
MKNVKAGIEFFQENKFVQVKADIRADKSRRKIYAE